MAALFKPAHNSEHVTPREESFNEETLDQSCDVILVVEDGKEFKAHKRVLSEASPFFEKMLRSDMKESKEGMVRLEMFSEPVMRDTLEFIYTGNVQILAEHNARDLIVIADYMLLEKLKTLAEEVLLQKLNTSNCIPTYYVAQRYRCEGLFAKSKTFILANFTAVYKANPEEVLNISSKEIEMWISSDEINVCAEEDVFRIILAWIDHDKSKRNKYFAELFRQVRLVYVSRDFLCSDIVTNVLVKDNEGCLDLVEDAMRLIDSKDFGNLSVTPRKSLETPVIAVTYTGFDSANLDWVKVKDSQCYFPREDSWCSLGEIGPSFSEIRNTVSCRGKLYSIVPGHCQLTRYDLCSNSCVSLPQRGDREFRRIFVSNEDEMYALVTDTKPLFDVSGDLQRGRVSYLTKYKPESNSWEDSEDISYFDKFKFRGYISIVAKDNFVYFIGGVEFRCSDVFEFPTEVHRYDLSRNQWDKVADIQEPKIFPCGAVANGKIFISARMRRSKKCQCEVYDETTNEWQFIASFKINPRADPKLLSVDGKLYALGIMMFKNEKWGTGTYTSLDPRVQCYDPGKNKWKRKTEISFRWHQPRILCASAYSMRIFKGFLDYQLKSFPSEPAMPTSRHLGKQRRDKVDGRLMKVDTIPPAPGSSVRGDQPLTEVPVDPVPARSTQRKCCFIL